MAVDGICSCLIKKIVNICDLTTYRGSGFKLP